MRQPCGALLPLPLPARVRRYARICFLTLWSAAAGAGTPLTPAPEAPPTPGEMLGAIVTVGVRTVANARSAPGQSAERHGTGVVIEPGAYVLTSAFLVQEADSVVVTTADARTVRAAVVEEDETTGVAILRPADGLGVRPLPLGSSDAVETTAAVSIASAANGRSLAAARLVAKRQFAGHWEYLVENALFTTPPIRDWAGAALIDGNGRLIGIGSLLLADVRPGGTTATPGNLFIPVERFKPALTRLAIGDNARSTRRPWLGLVFTRSEGPLVIAEVPPGSPAERAGLQVGDVVTAVNGDPVASYAALYRRIWRERPGAELILTIRRGGAPHEVRLRAIDPQDYLIHRASR